MKEKKLLSNRVNFPSIQMVIDDYLPKFTAHFSLDEKQTEDMRIGLHILFEQLLFEIQCAMELGTKKGISEALEKMKDEKYYEVVKRRKQRELEAIQGRLKPKPKSDDSFFDIHDIIG